MNAIALMVAMSATGIDCGWHQLEDGDVEYVIQIEPMMVDQLKDGFIVTSEIPEDLRGVRRFRIQIGDQPLTQEKIEPPRRDPRLDLLGVQPPTADRSSVYPKAPVRPDDRGRYTPVNDRFSNAPPNTPLTAEKERGGWYDRPKLDVAPPPIAIPGTERETQNELAGASLIPLIGTPIPVPTIDDAPRDPRSGGGGLPPIVSRPAETGNGQPPMQLIPLLGTPISVPTIDAPTQDNPFDFSRRPRIVEQPDSDAFRPPRTADRGQGASIPPLLDGGRAGAPILPPLTSSEPKMDGIHNPILPPPTYERSDRSADRRSLLWPSEEEQLPPTTDPRHNDTTSASERPPAYVNPPENSSPVSSASYNETDEEGGSPSDIGADEKYGVEEPPRSMLIPLLATLLLLFTSVGGNVYLSWIAWEANSRYRSMIGHR
jgi:hypothetical protein